MGGYGIKSRAVKIQSERERDHNPPHVHVEGGGATARVNLLTLEILDDSTDFSKTMVRKIVTYIAEHKEELLEKWVEYHEED